MASEATRAEPAALLWAGETHTRRRAAPSESEIAAAAVRLADVEGLGSVTMRRLAQELGTGTTSLYRYVHDKDELVERMLDAAYGDSPVPVTLTGDWRSDLRAVARATRAVMLKHPWLTDGRFHRPAFGPNALARMETALAAASGVSADPTTSYLALGAVLDFVIGSVTRQLAELIAQRESGLDWEGWQASLAPLVRKIVADGDHPNVSERILHADETTFERQFEFGLDCLINGIASPT